MKGLMQDRPLNVGLIIRHAERIHGDKTLAVRTERGHSVATYTQVCERARRLVSALRRLGVGPDDRVATFSWNHQQHLEAYLGVPAMGSILHTLNIRLFDQDLAYIVEHAEDSVVIVDECLWPAWDKVRARISCVKKTIVVHEGTNRIPGTLDYEELIAAHAPANDLPEVPEDQAAAICYTSGTTGKPKGVVYSHRSNYLHSLMALGADTLALSERDTVLPIVPMFHANAWGMPYGYLMAGSNMVMPGRFLQPQILLDCLIERRVTFAAGVPSIWIAMLEPLTKAKDRLSLDRIGCGGSAVPPSLQRAYREQVGVPILQAWGMTETSPLASLNCLSRVRRASPADLEAIEMSAGKCVPGLEIRITDDDGKELPQDGKSVGEIQIRGPWIANAYFKDGASPEKFSPDGWLRTGDVAALAPGGAIRITDRTKDLIKSGGEWISSVEIEGHIMGHPEVAEAAVIAVAHPKWCERPLACVVARKKGSLSRDAILDFLKPRVARWWLPDDVVFVDEIPKTSVGKFDKKLLRQRFQSYVFPNIDR
jgi:fatty-acyl-CoA synthase